MHGIERFLQDFYNDFELLRVSYRFAYPVRRSTSSLVRRRAWVSSPLARYLLLSAPRVDLLFIVLVRIDLLQGYALESGSHTAFGGILRRAEISVSRSIRGTSSAYSPRTANSCCGVSYFPSRVSTKDYEQSGEAESFSALIYLWFYVIL